MAGKSDVVKWLERSDWPGDFYQLLGLKRLDPDAGGMRKLLEAAAGEVAERRADADPLVADRAKKLLEKSFAAASRALSSDANLAAEEDRLCKDLKATYAAKHGDDPAQWDRDHLTSWLRNKANVHPANLEFARESMLPDGKPVERKRGPQLESAPAAPILIEPTAPLEAAAPLLLDDEEQEDSLPMAPVLIDEESPPAATPVVLVSGNPRSGGRARPPRPVAAKPAVVVEAVLEPEPAPANKAKVAFLLSCLIGVPLAVLIGALLWMNARKNADEPGPSVAENQSEDRSDDDRDVEPHRDDDRLPQPDPAAERRNRFLAAIDAAKSSKSRTRANHIDSALKLAENDRDRVQAYKLLAEDEDALRTVTELKKISAAVHALATDADASKLIDRFVSRLESRASVRAGMEVFLRRLELRRSDLQAERAIREFCESDAMDRLKQAEMIVLFERAGKAHSTLRISLSRRLIELLKKRNGLHTAFADYANKVKAAKPDETELAYAVAVAAAVQADPFESSRVDRGAVFEVNAAVIRTAPERKKEFELNRLLDRTEKDSATKDLEEFCRNRLKGDAKDEFALAVLRRLSDDRLKAAGKATGIRTVTLVDEALALAPTATDKAEVVAKAMNVGNFRQTVDFEKAGALYEKLIQSRLDEKSPTAARMREQDVAGFLKFVDEREKIEFVADRYAKRREADPKDAVAQQVCNGLAKHHVEKVTAKYDGQTAWAVADVNAVETHLEVADLSARAEQLRQLLSDVQFKRALTLHRYLRLQEEVVAGNEGFARSSQVAALLTVLTTDPSIQVKVPIAKPNVREQQSYRVAQAVKYYANRLKTGDGKRAARLEMLRGLLQLRSTKSLYLRKPGTSSAEMRQADQNYLLLIEKELQNPTPVKSDAANRAEPEREIRAAAVRRFDGEPSA